MALRPYSADLQQTFRTTLGTPGAPEVIDDSQPVVPVAIVAGSVNVSTNVAVTPSLNQPLPSQTVITRFQYLASTGAVIYTVPAGKTFYCTGALLETVVTGADIRIAVAGVDTIRCLTQGASIPIRLSGGILFQATAGQAITLVHAAGASNGVGNIWGFEV